MGGWVWCRCDITQDVLFLESMRLCKDWDRTRQSGEWNMDERCHEARLPKHFDQ